MTVDDDQFVVVNAEAGVWRCVRCDAHVPSPAEHRKVCPGPAWITVGHLDDGTPVLVRPIPT